MIIEPVLGEGGYVPAPRAFMKGLRDICDEHGILLIADEVQTGFGRTGTLFACDQHPEAPPDILVMAKGLASGFPLAAIAANNSLTETQVRGRWWWWWWWCCCCYLCYGCCCCCSCCADRNAAAGNDGGHVRRQRCVVRCCCGDAEGDPRRGTIYRSRCGFLKQITAVHP